MDEEVTAVCIDKVVALLRLDSLVRRHPNLFLEQSWADLPSQHKEIRISSSAKSAFRRLLHSRLPSLSCGES